MNKTLKFFVVLAAALVLTGCAITPDDERGKIAVTYSVLKLVEQSDSIDGDRVLSAVERVRAGVDGAVVVRAEDLTAVVLAELNFDGLSPADRFLIESVIGQVERQLVLDVETGVLPEDYGAQLDVWLRWIEEAAYLAGASGGE